MGIPSSSSRYGLASASVYRQVHLGETTHSFKARTQLSRFFLKSVLHTALTGSKNVNGQNVVAYI